MPIDLSTSDLEVMRVVSGEAIKGRNLHAFRKTFNPSKCDQLVEVAERYFDAVKNGLIDDEEITTKKELTHGAMANPSSAGILVARFGG